MHEMTHEYVYTITNTLLFSYHTFHHSRIHRQKSLSEQRAMHSNSNFLHSGLGRFLYYKGGYIGRRDFSLLLVYIHGWK